MAINSIPAELRTATRDAAFWERIDVRGPEECWLWKIDTQLSQNGYGAAFYGPIHTTAHRIAYMLTKGPIPNGKQVLHSCASRWDHDPRQGRRCCNQWHLYAGSPQDNMDDKIRLGRQFRPVDYDNDGNPNAKLTTEQLPQFFEDAKTMSQRTVAAKYGISKSQVGNILRGESRANAIKSIAEDKREAILDANARRTKR